jgi:hypothetical protein
MSQQMPISVHAPLRFSWYEPARATIVSCHNSTLLVDDAEIPTELTRLMPLRAGRWSPEEWRPFCDRAVALGIM